MFIFVTTEKISIKTKRMNLIKDENVYKSLQKAAIELDTNIADIARGAGVDRSHIQYWKDGTPGAICNLIKMQNEINRRVSEKSKTPTKL